MKSLLTMICENFLSETRAGSNDMPLQVQFDFRFRRALKEQRQPFSENREHLKIFRNVDCVLANYNKVQDTKANLKTTNLLPLLFAV